MFKKTSVVCVLLVLFLSLSVSSAQDPIKLPFTNTPSLDKDLEIVIPDDIPRDYPIVVYPGARGFNSLQEAFDSCVSGGDDDPRTAGRDYLVFLYPGQYTGNFTLPTSGIRVVGLGGMMGTYLIGKPGANAPTIRYNPAGSVDKSYAWFQNLWIFGTEDAALECNGSSAYASLWIKECQLETEKNHPAIRVLGGGASEEKKLSVDISNTGIESNGKGVEFDIDNYVQTVFIDSSITEATSCATIKALSATGNEFNFYRTVLFGDSGITAENLSLLWIGNSIINVQENAMNVKDTAEVIFDYGHSQSQNTHLWIFSGVPYIRTQYSKLSAESGGYNCVRLLDHSEAKFAYTGFYCDTKTASVYADTTSVWEGIYNHWRLQVYP